MTRKMSWLAAMWACFMALACVNPHVEAADLLTPGDPILAIDLDPDRSRSAYPLGEEPWLSLDNDSFTKYLNFSKEGSGLIFNPNSGSAIVQSMRMRTANDGLERDPMSWELYGTNDPISSVDNGDGNEENWQLIGMGAADLPIARQTDGPLYTFTNSADYSSYKIVFPTLRNTALANSMQIADINIYTTSDGTGTPIGDFFDFAIALGELRPDSNYPNPGPNGPEGPAEGIDGDPFSKYLNFGEENSGFIVTPSGGSSIIDGFEITTANDFPLRDPSSWELYGTNDAILSTDNSRADGGEAWTLIDAGSLALPDTRFGSSGVVPVVNSAEYESYLMVFPTVKDPEAEGSDSMQFTDIQFFGQIVSMGPACDLDGDGDCDTSDLRQLYDDIAAGTAANSDIATWLADAGLENGKTYLPGDADLDGSVSGGDFTAVASSFGGSGLPGAYWDQGNFDGNEGGSFAVSGGDFTALASNFGSTSIAAVPEPAALPCVGICLIALTFRRRLVRN